jgi:hypothetical protein
MAPYQRVFLHDSDASLDGPDEDAAEVSTFDQQNDIKSSLHLIRKPTRSSSLEVSKSNGKSETTISSLNRTTKQKNQRQHHQKSTKKTVRFNLAKNRTLEITHVNDLSDEEYDAIWYAPEDYTKIKKNIIAMVKVLVNGKKVAETDKQSARGLEYRTPEGAQQRQVNKITAIAALLDEQDRQLDYNGRTNDVALAAAYIAASKHCQDEAHALALTDVEPAFEHCADATVPIIRALHRQQQQQERRRKKSAAAAAANGLPALMTVRRRPSIIERK